MRPSPTAQSNDSIATEVVVSGGNVILRVDRIEDLDGRRAPGPKCLRRVVVRKSHALFQSCLHNPAEERLQCLGVVVRDRTPLSARCAQMSSIMKDLNLKSG